MIPDGHKFKDPIELIDFYKVDHTGLLTAPKFPCKRQPNQEAIAYRGLSYQDLHSLMKREAEKMVSNISFLMPIYLYIHTYTYKDLPSITM